MTGRATVAKAIRPALSRCLDCGAAIGPVIQGSDGMTMTTQCRCGYTLVAWYQGHGERTYGGR